jgi:hypothetical protein
VYEPPSKAGIVNSDSPPNPPPPVTLPPPPPPQTSTSTYLVPDGAVTVVDDVNVDDGVYPVSRPLLNGEKRVKLDIKNSEIITQLPSRVLRLHKLKIKMH